MNQKRRKRYRNEVLTASDLVVKECERLARRVERYRTMVESDHAQEWICLGSSPISQYYSRLKQQHPDAKVITSNKGITIEPRPQFLWISDPVAWERWKDAAMSARLNGTVLLSTTNTSSPAKEVADVLLNLTGSMPERVPEWRRGHYSHPRLSGLIIVQWALNHGATHIHLLGYEGYEPKEDRPGRDFNFWQETFLQRLVYQSPNVTFHFYGSPVYKIPTDLGNLRLYPF